MADKKKGAASANRAKVSAGRMRSQEKASSRVRERMISALQMNSIKSGIDGGSGSKPAGYGAFNSSKFPATQRARMADYGAYKNPNYTTKKRGK